MPTSRSPVALVVADANAILSAIVGGAAARVFTSGVTAIHVAEPTLEEVARYSASMAIRRGLNPGNVALAIATLPVNVHAATVYISCLAKAAKRLHGRDVDDCDVLALSLHLDSAVWSNDHDFDGTGVEVYSTAKLLRILKVRTRTPKTTSNDSGEDRENYGCFKRQGHHSRRGPPPAGNPPPDLRPHGGPRPRLERIMGKRLLVHVSQDDAAAGAGAPRARHSGRAAAEGDGGAFPAPHCAGTSGLPRR